jgi:hypothetical protein
MHGPKKNALLESYPDAASPLKISGFFDTLYLRYDERFVTSAPDLARTTRRLEWDALSPALALPGPDYEAHKADEEKP